MLLSVEMVTVFRVANECVIIDGEKYIQPARGPTGSRRGSTKKRSRTSHSREKSCTKCHMHIYSP